MSLEEIIERGTPIARANRNNIVTCKDGFTMSVIANYGAYCSPRPAFCVNLDYVRKLEACGECKGYDGEMTCGFSGPFTACEMGFPSERPEPWSIWENFADNPEEPTETVYAFVPVTFLRDLVALHGGENA